MSKMSKFLKSDEKTVLAEMLKHPDKRSGYSKMLTKESFLNFEYMRIFEVITSNIGNSETDIVNAIHSDSIRYNYNAIDFIDYYEMEMLGCMDTNSLDKIVQFERFRSLEGRFSAIDPYDPTEEAIQALYSDIKRVPDGLDYISAVDCFQIVGTDLQNKDSELNPRFSGIKEYDEIIGGFTEGMHVVSGRAGSGKSTIAAQVLMSYAENNKDKISVFFSVEMSKRSISRRTVSHIAKVDNRKLKKRKLNKEDVDKIVFFGNKAPENCVFVPCSGICVSEAISILEKIKNDLGLEIGLVCFDYLQKMTPNNKNSRSENEEIKWLSSDLTEFSKNIPTIVVSNLNKPREGKETSCPTVGDIKGGSIIEFDATSMMMLYRPKLDVAEIYSRMVKNRDDEPGQDAVWMLEGSVSAFYFKGWLSEEKQLKSVDPFNPF